MKNRIFDHVTGFEPMQRMDDFVDDSLVSVLTMCTDCDILFII